MTPARRVVLAATVAVIGGMLAAIGTASRWYAVVAEGREVTVPDVGTTRFPPTVFEASGSDVAGATPMLAVLVLLAAGLMFLAGRWGRVVLLAVCALAALALAVVAFTSGGVEDALAATPEELLAQPGDPTVSAGPGRPLTIAGALLATAGAGWGIPIAGRVAVARLPEGAPLDETPEGS